MDVVIGKDSAVARPSGGLWKWLERQRPSGDEVS